MYTVRRQPESISGTWGIYKGKALVEGGFFSRDLADDACYEWNNGTR